MSDIERRLRAALRSVEPDESVGRRLRASVPGPSPAAARRRRVRRIGRLGRPLLAAAWIAALAAFSIALVVIVDGGDEPEGSAVAPPPLRYAVFELPQTAKEAAIRLPQALAPLESSSVRDAGTADGYRYLVARMEAGGFCIRRLAPNDAVVEDCASPTSPGLRVISPYSESAEGPRRVFGIVPDAVTAVEVNGQAGKVTDNVWNAEIPSGSEQVTIDLRTDQGVVSEWRDELVSTRAPMSSSCSRPTSGSPASRQTRPGATGSASRCGCASRRAAFAPRSAAARSPSTIRPGAGRRAPG